MEAVGAALPKLQLPRHDTVAALTERRVSVAIVAPLVTLLVSLYVFWILPKQLGAPDVRVEYVPTDR